MPFSVSVGESGDNKLVYNKESTQFRAVDLYYLLINIVADNVLLDVKSERAEIICQGFVSPYYCSGVLCPSDNCIAAVDLLGGVGEVHALSQRMSTQYIEDQGAGFVPSVFVLMD